MRRLLVLAMFVGLALSLGCGDEKVIAPKDVPPQPKGPPVGQKQKKGENPGVSKTATPNVAP